MVAAACDASVRKQRRFGGSSMARTLVVKKAVGKPAGKVAAGPVAEAETKR
jgi:hypothetical protein